MAIPEGWETVSLSDCGDGIRPAIKAGPFGSALKKSSYVKDGYRVYGQEQVIANDFSVGDYFVDDEKFSALRACAVHPGDVLISLVGTFGRVAIVPRNASPGIINPRLVRIAPDASRIDSGYLAVYIQSPIVQKVLVETAQGGTMGVLNATTLSKLSVTLPPLPEQKKIAAILSSVDETIAKTEAVIAQLQIVKKAMMEQLLTKGMPGRHTRFKQTEIGEIPEEWEVASVRDVAKSVVPGRNKPSVFDGTIPWLTIADLQHTVVTDSSAGLRVSQTELNNCGGKTVPAGTVIMSCVGRLGIVSISGCIVTMNQQLHGFACGPSIDPLFLCLVLRSAERQMQALAGKTTIPYLNKARCEEIVIPLPCLPEQRAVAEQIAPIETSLASEEAVLLQMRHLKSALSSSLLSGEIRVVPEVA